MSETRRSFFTPRTKEQAKDTGMAVVLLFLLLSLILHLNALLLAAVAALVLAMIVPNLFRPLAVLWFGGAEVLGMLMSRLLLVVVFFVIVTPVGLLRRLFGKDELLLRLFRRNTKSVMEVRDHTFTASDFETPF